MYNEFIEYLILTLAGENDMMIQTELYKLEFLTKVVSHFECKNLSYVALTEYDNGMYLVATDTHTLCSIALDQDAWTNPIGDVKNLTLLNPKLVMAMAKTHKLNSKQTSFESDHCVVETDNPNSYPNTSNVLNNAGDLVDQIGMVDEEGVFYFFEETGMSLTMMSLISKFVKKSQYSHMSFMSNPLEHKIFYMTDTNIRIMMVKLSLPNDLKKFKEF